MAQDSRACHVTTTGLKACIPVLVDAPHTLLASHVTSVAALDNQLAVLLQDGQLVTLSISSKPALVSTAFHTTVAALVYIRLVCHCSDDHAGHVDGVGAGWV